MRCLLKTIICLFVDNAIDWLSGHMKGRYHSSMRLKKCKEENDPWPPIKTNSYVTLALVHQKALQTRQETTTTIYLRTKGDIDKIPQTIDAKKLTKIAQIFDPVSGVISNSILIEGYAGIGKTTLVKEICVEWAEGKLLASDKLVLLLLLRDPDVQKITNEHKLVEYFTNYSTTELYNELIKNQGANTTLIIDGFDELSTELRHESFFRKLIEKSSLSSARIVVTSRPSASACLHHVIDRRIKILGFEQSSKNQYVNEALQDYPFKVQKLKRHFQQYPNIDAICYIPLIMSIIVFLCMCQPDELPPTATRMYASFILNTICHYLKRVGYISEEKVISKLEQLPQEVYTALQQMEKIAFNGLVEDRIVFTDEELPVLCKNDPTFYGLLQSTECYSAEQIGTCRSFNFLHLGIQEYFAAKYVTTLPEDEVLTHLKESFIVTQQKDTYYGDPNPDSKSIRLSNMWILYCGITSGQCKTLRHYLTTYSDDFTSHNQQIGPMLSPPYNTKTISQDVLKDRVKVFYLFQCFQEAQDNELCEILSESFDGGVINIISHKLLPHQVVSLGFFLSKSHKKWKELNLCQCKIGDHGMSILHQYLCGDKANKQGIAKINLGANDLTGASSHLIADIISHLQPHTLILHYNKITNVRDISTAVIDTSTVKVLHINEGLTAQEAVAISSMMVCLEELYIHRNKLGDNGAELLLEGIKNTKTLRVLDISCNKIGPSGTTAIANALTNNTTLEKLNISNNKLGDNGAELLLKGITNTKTMRILDISCNNIGPPGTTAIANALTNNASLEELSISSNKLGDNGAELLSVGIRNTKILRVLHMDNNNIGPSGTTATAKALTNNTSLEELNMSGNKVGRDGVIAIAKAINNNRTLKKLLLDDDDLIIDKEPPMLNLYTATILLNCILLVYYSMMIV